MGPVVKNLPANAGDVRHVGSIPELARSPEVRNGNPLQHSCLENSMVGYSPWDCKKSDTTEHALVLDETLSHIHLEHASIRGPTLICPHSAYQLFSSLTDPKYSS